MLKKFVAEAYAKLVEVDVKRLDIPDRDFTGEKSPVSWPYCSGHYSRVINHDSSILHAIF